MSLEIRPLFRAMLARLPRPSRAALLLIVIWALEIYAVQELTLVPGHWQSFFGAAIYRIVRITIDLLACGLCVAALPRPVLGILFALNPVFYIGVILYHDYYQQPLSMHALLETSGEGVQVAGAFWGLVEGWQAVFIVLLAAKMILLFGTGLSRFWPTRRRSVGLLLGAYFGFVALVNPLLQPLAKIGTWDSVGGIGAIYGYGLTWLAELVYLDVDTLRERAIARSVDALPIDVDRLLAEEGSFPVGERLVFLQVESLDLALIDFTIDGREVTPELNRLWRRSLRYATLAPKGMGSSDADFRALMGRVPAKDVPTYKIPGYPYGGSFVEHLRALGVVSAAIHGVTGEFFNRRRAYEEMPFEALLFREELLEQGVGAGDFWAIDDGLVLDATVAHVAKAPAPSFVLVITATSHIPFPLAAADRVFFPGENEANYAYFDSIHYVDRLIGNFVEALPPGTTVVIYGDHISKVENAELGYRQRLHQGEGCVPFLILESGADMHQHQRIPDELALSCELTSLHAFRLVQGRALEAFAVDPPSREVRLSNPSEEAAQSARGAY